MNSGMIVNTYLMTIADKVEGFRFKFIHPTADFVAEFVMEDPFIYSLESWRKVCDHGLTLEGEKVDDIHMRVGADGTKYLVFSLECPLENRGICASIEIPAASVRPVINKLIDDALAAGCKFGI